MSFHDSPELLDKILAEYGDCLDFLQLQVTLRPDQWRRLVEVVPKVMKILRIE